MKRMYNFFFSIMLYFCITFANVVLSSSAANAMFWTIEDASDGDSRQQLLGGRADLYLPAHADQLCDGDPSGRQHVHQSPRPRHEVHIL